ncbi:MAG TPA: MupA/Atu3671 family FMN-dependent luciferase-like monooxygenase [Mycobacteriales bacterium]|nr:MupA/Atu3671 family FMN-dependent luciferase-like monooxygenase [Mycobacteriales bacterium]
MDFSLFYFADDSTGDADRYRLLTEGARFADRHDFTAVWTPERHFHPFGGRYPNPAVTGAAVAAITERVAVRAGSVVAPLHHPARIAEEWSVVDNLSGGRVGMAFASGWHVSDFVLRPENYPRRKEAVVEAVQVVRRLWRQESVPFTDGSGRTVQIRTYPPPVQPELPVWLTSAGSVDTFRTAGELGAGVLTHLLGQDLDDLSDKIAAYRKSYAAGAGDGTGHVVLMLHAMLGTNRGEVKDLVRAPFSAYLRSSIGLIARAAGATAPGFDPDKLAPADVDFLVSRSFDRYFDTGGLFGTVEDGVAVVARLRGLGIDEVACLIDFGVPPDDVLASLTLLDEVRRAVR